MTTVMMICIYFTNDRRRIKMRRTVFNETSEKELIAMQ